MAADYSTGAALFLFFLVTLLINPLAKLLTGTSLHTGELATVYIMMVVGAAIPSWGLTMNLIPLLGGFFYYATPENDWANTIQPYISHLFVPERQRGHPKAVRRQRPRRTHPLGGLGDAADGVEPVCRQHVLHHAVRTRRAAQAVGRARAAQLPA